MAGAPRLAHWASSTEMSSQLHQILLERVSNYRMMRHAMWHKLDKDEGEALWSACMQRGRASGYCPSLTELAAAASQRVLSNSEIPAAPHLAASLDAPSLGSTYNTCAEPLCISNQPPHDLDGRRACK